MTAKFKIICESCGRRLNLGEQHVGQKVRCRCGSVMRIVADPDAADEIPTGNAGADSVAPPSLPPPGVAQSSNVRRQPAVDPQKNHIAELSRKAAAIRAAGRLHEAVEYDPFADGAPNVHSVAVARPARPTAQTLQPPAEADNSLTYNPARELRESVTADQQRIDRRQELVDQTRARASLTFWVLGAGGLLVLLVGAGTLAVVLWQIGIIGNQQDLAKADRIGRQDTVERKVEADNDPSLGNLARPNAGGPENLVTPPTSQPGRRPPNQQHAAQGGFSVLPADLGDTPAQLPKGSQYLNSLGMSLQLIPRGVVSMGSLRSEQGRGADEFRHKVELTAGYYLAAHEVTQKQYSKLLGFNPVTDDTLVADDNPVTFVSWFDAALFCNKLSESEGRAPVYILRNARRRGGHLVDADVTISSTATGYRLPTEAEWEHACRAGSNSTFHFGYQLAAGQVNALNTRAELMPVGQFRSNNYGLYDMHGNAMEWCQDWYADDYYERSPGVDPKGPMSGEHRVARGGSFESVEAELRSAARDSFAPESVSPALGFRVLLVH